jgi:uncharacterized protein
MADEILTRFSEGINKFNEHEFYECHDLLEEVWFDSRGVSRRFYQGLIHLAVGFYHITLRDNPTGSLSQLKKGVEKLTAYAPEFQGVELRIFLLNIKKCIEEIELIKKGRTELFDPSLAPKINFNRELFIPEE